MAAARLPDIITVAPTWGSSSFIESDFGLDVMEAILALGIVTSLRLHPMTLRHHPTLLSTIEEHFCAATHLRFESDITGVDSLVSSAVLVTDWSGAATEYVLGTGRPAVLIDMPAKVNNPRYVELGCEPLEMRFRRELGLVIPPTDLGRIGGSLTEHFRLDTNRVRAFRENWVYNNGTTAQ
jgi:YidC/Oxa1 family membrane protein insertase